MASDPKPTTRAERRAIKDYYAADDGSLPRDVDRLLADLDRADAIMERLVAWNSGDGYYPLADIQADARRLREAWE